MSLYERINGTGDSEKIPIWPLLHDAWQVMEGMETLEGVAERFDLSAEDAARLNQILTATLTKAGGDRVKAWHDAWQIAIGVEIGRLTDEQIDEFLGL